MPASSHKLEPKQLTGQKIGKYLVGDLLGQGATGDVYAAKSKAGSIAVKLLNPMAARDSEAVARFEREAETAQRLAHPNIIKVLEVGNWRGRPYLVMELVHGGSLRRLLERGSPEALLSVMTETAYALAYAHAQGVIHRDVKPDNVLLTRSSRRARVADFGLARAADEPSMTTEGKLMGTAHYMSPEQARGGKASGYSDVYAVGIMLYEMVTGKRPFSSEETLGLLYQHAEVAPERPVVRWPYPASLGNLALACLAKTPQDRPEMSTVAERLAATRLVRRGSRWRRFAIAAAVLAVVVAILAPSILSPLCHGWFGGGVFRAARRGATVVHHALFTRSAGAH